MSYPFLSSPLTGIVLWLVSGASRSVALSTASTRIQRKFQFVPYGSECPETDLPIITCDGNVPGAALQLTHWTGNTTPEKLYADTSTGMALALAEHSDEFPEYDTSLVLNNHYDTDGVLSVWACLEPEEAKKHADILVSGAEAGDFGEWNSDEGIKLDFVVSNFLQGDDEAEAYRSVLEELPAILRDFRDNDGVGYEDLWRGQFDECLEDWEILKSGQAKLYQGSNEIVILEESLAKGRMSPYALHRGLKESGLWSSTSKILRANPQDGCTKWHYNYEKVGHGWVSKLKSRRMVPNVDKEGLVSRLNEAMAGTAWATGGRSGLVAICRTTQAVPVDPVKAATTISRLETDS